MRYPDYVLSEEFTREVRAALGIRSEPVTYGESPIATLMKSMKAGKLAEVQQLIDEALLNGPSIHGKTPHFSIVDEFEAHGYALGKVVSEWKTYDFSKRKPINGFQFGGYIDPLT